MLYDGITFELDEQGYKWFDIYYNWNNPDDDCNIVEGKSAIIAKTAKEAKEVFLKSKRRPEEYHPVLAYVR